MKHQPPSFDRLIQTGLVLVRRAFLAVQEWPVDQLDPAVLHGLDAAGDLKDLAGGLFGIGVGSVSGEFHRHPHHRGWVDLGHEKKRANGPKREVRFAPINGHRKCDAVGPKSADIVL